MDFFDILFAKKLENDQDPTVEGLTVTKNGTYSEEGVVYDVVNAEIPLGSKTITENGTYNAEDDELEGYTDVTVAVAGYKPQSYEASDIITFSDGVNLPMLSCIANIEAVQDLHGQPSPYPAGGGKNKLPCPTAETKTSGSLSVTTDGDGNFTVSGTTGDSAVVILFDLPVNFTIPTSIDTGGNGCFYLFNTSARNDVYVELYYDNTEVEKWGCSPVGRKSSAYTNMGGQTINKIGVRVTANTSLLSFKISPMITADGTSSETSFAPYSNICPITGWTGCNLTVAGKNMLDETAGAAGYFNSDGTIHASVAWKYQYIKVNPNTKYTISNIPTPVPAVYLCWFDLNKNFISNSGSHVNGTITSPNNAVYLGFCVYQNNELGANIQIELGETATTYSPYNGTTCNVTWSSQGTIYGGYVDLCSGILTATKALIDMGDMTWTYQSANTRFVSSDIQSLSKYPSSNDNPSNIMCSSYANNSYRDYTDKQIAQSNTGNVFVKDSSYTDATAFKTAMDGVQLVYELAAPQTYQLTPSQVKTLLNDNVIFADCGRVAAEVWKSL